MVLPRFARICFAQNSRRQNVNCLCVSGRCVFSCLLTGLRSLVYAPCCGNSQKQSATTQSGCKTNSRSSHSVAAFVCVSTFIAITSMTHPSGIPHRQIPGGEIISFHFFFVFLYSRLSRRAVSRYRYNTNLPLDTALRRKVTFLLLSCCFLFTFRALSPTERIVMLLFNKVMLIWFIDLAY